MNKTITALAIMMASFAATRLYYRKLLCHLKVVPEQLITTLSTLV